MLQMLLVRPERHAELGQQGTPLHVRLGGRRDDHVETAQLLDRVVVDLGEDGLLAHAHGEVAAPVELGRRDAAKVADARQGDGDETVDHLVHALAAQGDPAADGHALAQLEAGDGLARLGDRRALAADERQVLDGGVEQLGVGLGLADAHVEGHLADARHFHHVAVAELLFELRHDLFEVLFLEPGHRHLRLFDIFSAALAAALTHLAPVVEQPVADTGRLTAGRADEHHVRRIDGRLALDHATLRVLLRVRLGVLLHDVEPLEHDTAMLDVDAYHLGGLAGFLAAEDLHLVALFDLHLAHHNTSGASDTIFMKFFSRSSRATGPKIRVPRGLFWLSISTAAFSSNAMYVPSLRPNSFLVRTTTARTTSPFFTPPPGVATLLSATRSLDSTWIICFLCRLSYLAFLRISRRRHRFIALNGRVSTTRTRSPTPAAFCSSCAWSLLERRTTLPYRSCF